MLADNSSYCFLGHVTMFDVKELIQRSELFEWVNKKAISLLLGKQSKIFYLDLLGIFFTCNFVPFTVFVYFLLVGWLGRVRVSCRHDTTITNSPWKPLVMGKQAKISQMNKNICIKRNSNLQPFTPQSGAIYQSATLTDDELGLKVLHNHAI